MFWEISMNECVLVYHNKKNVFFIWHHKGCISHVFFCCSAIYQQSTKGCRNLYDKVSQSDEKKFIESFTLFPLAIVSYGLYCQQCEDNCTFHLNNTWFCCSFFLSCFCTHAIICSVLFEWVFHHCVCLIKYGLV